MAVKVDQVTTAKTGRSLRVLLSGQWYGAAMDSGLNGQVGKMIEAEIETGKFGPWIKKWVPSNAAPQGTPPASSVPPAGSPAAAAPYQREPAYAEASDNIQPWYMPFVSNTVAHAIEKGLIQSPVGINEWALKAAQVAQAIKEAVK